MDTALLLAKLVLAGVFGVAGLAKLADLPGSRQAVVGFGLPERLAPAAGLPGVPTFFKGKPPLRTLTAVQLTVRT